MGDSHVNALVEMTFEEVKQADIFGKVIRKYLDKGIMKVLKMKRSKNVFKMICEINTEKDWEDITIKDFENLKPDAIKLEDLSKKDQEKVIEACEGLENISMKLDMFLDLA